MLISGIVYEYIFFAGAIMLYLIASTVSGIMCIALLSTLPHEAHLKPLSFMLKYSIFIVSEQFVHSFIFGVKPNIESNLNLKVDTTWLIFLSVYDIV